MDELTHEGEEVYGTAETAFDTPTDTPLGTTTETPASTDATPPATSEPVKTDDKKVDLAIPEGEAEGDEKKPEEAQKPEVEGSKEDFDVSEVEAEFISNNGELSAETMEALYKQFPKNLVDNYMANAKAALDASINTARTEVFSVVGGEESYGSIIQWAGKNLNPEEIASFNTVMAGGDLVAMKMAVKGLAAQANVSTSKAPQLITNGKAAVVGSGDTFDSQAQYVSAISDPRYDKDAAYRSDVRAKLSRTQKSGGYRNG